ncbi:piggyBac transposable element-derived protein 4 [Trichonephila clavipes]|nr:piggyBac transposable element-derived protein 4 [Trichonephila clavipes]
MGVVRYGLLMKFLHFANNESSSDLDHNMKLKKIREFHNLVVHKFKSVFVPKPDISVDESLIAYKGRLSCKQYIPQKRARFGIKLFQLCESESGYIWNSLIYTGKGTAFNENYNDYGLLTKSVLTLIHELKGKGYCLSTDNFYTSPELAEILIGSKTDICGTLRPNRNGLPVSLKSSTVKKGEIIAFQKDHIGFRTKLIERLIEEGGSDYGSRNFVGPKISENVVRLIGRHFPSYVESDSSKKKKKNIAKMCGMQP